MANTKITSNVIADDAITSDQLGGDLTMPGHVSLADNKEIRVGTGNDLVIKHDGSHTTLTNTTGNLTLAGDAVYIANAANSEYLAQFIANGAASLRYDNTEQLATVSGGVYIPNKLGIGVNAPARLPLHIHNSTDNADSNIHLTSNETGSTSSDGFTIAVSPGGANDGNVALIQRENANMLFYTNSTERMRIDSVGTLKVGAVVPTPGSGWDANLDAIQVGEASAFRSGDSDYSAATVMSTNIYQTGGGDKLLNGTDFGTAYTQQGGNHYFYGYENGNINATPAAATGDLSNPLIIHKGGGLSIGGGTIGNTVNGKAGIFWHGNPTNGAGYSIRRTADAWSGPNYAQLLLAWDTGVKIDVGNGAYGKSYLEVNGNVKFTAAGQGIDFSAAADAATGETVTSSVLDDYEEGTFTPFITTSGGNFTSGSQGPVGYYTKIGRQVFIELEVSISSSPAISGGSGDFRITGMPFDPVVSAAGNCTTGRVDPPTIGTWQAYQPAGQNYLNLRAIESGGDGIEVAGPGIITGNITPWFTINLIYTI
jgi:hypothetical protein